MAKVDRPERWILAFDGSCGTCTAASIAVREASRGRVEVAPLTRSEIEDLRQRVYGSTPPWRPTLIRDRGETVRAWVGARMAFRLALRLGARSSIRVLRALGEVREASIRQSASQEAPEPGSASAMSRKNFLRLTGGVAFVAGLTVAGQTPAFAESDMSRARAWVAANAAKLPTTYDQIGTYPIAYRKAILAKLQPGQVSKLWIEQLARYRDAHKSMTAAQSKVLNDGIALLDRLAAAADPDALHADLETFTAAAKSAFGEDEAATLFAQLGPADRNSKALVAAGNPVCSCSVQSDYCGAFFNCGYTVCNQQSGCGTFYRYTCNGLCFYS
jgi:hypothetical protein